jgi:hypothetical protein
MPSKASQNSCEVNRSGEKPQSEDRMLWRYQSPTSVFGPGWQVTPRIYLVLWGWGEAGAFNHTTAGQPANDPDGVAALMARFISAIGGTAWDGIASQYYQSNYDGTFSNITNPKQELAGVWNDDTTPIHDNLSPLELAQEAEGAAAFWRH